MTYHQRAALAGLGDIPAASQLGQIVSRDGFRYQITPDDVLWLARSVECEGGARAATAWTYAQRLVNRNGTSLASLVQAHSQPVNPIWAQMSGSGCQRDPSRCTPAQLARRHECATRPWDQLQYRDLILRWAQGGVPNPVPKATDFADAQVSTSFIGRNPGTQVILREGNWYLAETNGSHGAPTSWPAGFVSITYNGRSSGVSSLVGVPSYVPWLVAGGVGVAVLGGVAAYTMRRPRRAA